MKRTCIKSFRRTVNVAFGAVAPLAPYLGGSHPFPPLFALHHLHPLPCKQEMSQVCGRRKELSRMEVDDVALFTSLRSVRVGGPEHQVAHPHVTVTDGVETSTQRIGRTAKFQKQLKIKRKL